MKISLLYICSPYNAVARIKLKTKTELGIETMSPRRRVSINQIENWQISHYYTYLSPEYFWMKSNNLRWWLLVTIKCSVLELISNR